MTLCRIAPLILVLAACGSAPVVHATVDPVKPVVVAPKVYDPTGTFEYSTVVNGSTVTGNMIVVGTPGNYTGKITSNAFPEMPINSVVVDGQVLTMKGNTDQGELVIVVTVTGDTFAGKWTLGDGAGELSGKKLPKQ